MCWLCCKAQKERTGEEWSKPYPYARPFPPSLCPQGADGRGALQGPAGLFAGENWAPSTRNSVNRTTSRAKHNWQWGGGIFRASDNPRVLLSARGENGEKTPPPPPHLGCDCHESPPGFPWNFMPWRFLQLRLGSLTFLYPNWAVAAAPCFPLFPVTQG